VDIGWVRPFRDQRGQSLIEAALALPMLLLLLLGVVDGARGYYYAGLIANAAREGANYAARNATATRAQVTQRACDSTGLASFGNACPGLTATCTVANGDASVEVRYDFSLITASIVDAAFKVDPISIRADARFPLLIAGTPCAS
jgi:Flp pilus assembly protein TadG